MKKNKWKSKKWLVIWISELKYNPYKGVDVNKKRPVMIWNNSLSLQNKIICFHCTSSFNKWNKHLCKINLDGDGNKDTWVDLSKIYFVKTSDVISWNKNWGYVKNQQAKTTINEFIHKYFSNLNDKNNILVDNNNSTIIL